MRSLVQPVFVGHVGATAVYPLRQLVLRPGKDIESCVFSGDELESTIHLAIADNGGNMVCVGSFYHAGNTLVAARSPIQLRGMATHPSVRGMGYGKMLVKYALDHFRDLGHDVVWCNAREGAVTFYQLIGFDLVGDIFEIPDVGPHRVMWIKL